MRRGDIFWVDLQPRSGSEQQGRRPAIIVSRDSFNQALNWKSIIVVPLSTSNNQLRRGPTAVALASGSGGLNEDSVVLCHQVTTLDKSKFGQQIGTLPQDLMNQVDAGIKIALNLS